MTIPEVIAQLDVLDNELTEWRSRLKILRHDLFETLDNDPDALVE